MLVFIVVIYTKNKKYNVKITLPEKPTPVMMHVVTTVNDFLKLERAKEAKKSPQEIPEKFPDTYVVNGRIVNISDEKQRKRPLSDLNVNDATSIVAYCGLASQLIQAVQVRNVEEVEQILARSRTEPYIGTLDLNPLQIRNKSLLLFLVEHATSSGSPKIVECLLKAGADPAILDNNNEIPLVSLINEPHLTENHVAIAESLINRLKVKSDMKGEDNHYMTVASNAISSRLQDEQSRDNRDLLNKMLIEIQKKPGVGVEGITVFFDPKKQKQASSSQEDSVKSANQHSDQQEKCSII